MVRKILLGILLLGFITNVAAQCEIKGPRTACIDNVITFNITTSLGAISTYFWNFGTYGNSTNVSPIVKFTASGKVIAKCTITLAGGGTCIDTHAIVISANPLALVKFDIKSDTCLATNEICMLNKFQKGGLGFSKLNLIWGDGNLSTLFPPMAAKLCHKYTDTGTFSQRYELLDSSGCISKYDINVHVVQSVVVSHTRQLFFGCDSTKVCFYGKALGGSKFNYNWYSEPSNKKEATTATYCKFIIKGKDVSYKFYVTNEFGCKDSLRADTFAQDSFAYFPPVAKRICLANLLRYPLEPKNAYHIKPHDDVPGEYSATWTYNGKSLGKTPQININSGNAGWNYITMTSTKPCPVVQKDSFFLIILKAKAKDFNEFKRSPMDTVWFQDISKNVAGSRIARWWDFGDSFASTCTTWTKKKINIKSNCNFSRDSIAWHKYLIKQCPIDAKLVIYDTATNCYDEAPVEVYNAERCFPIVNKTNICIGGNGSRRWHTRLAIENENAGRSREGQ